MELLIMPSCHLLSPIAPLENEESCKGKSVQGTILDEFIPYVFLRTSDKKNLIVDQVGAYPARERPLKVLLDSFILVEVQGVLHKLNPLLSLLFFGFK